MKVSPAIEAAGYGLSGNIGGLPRKTYYTPDGRTIKAIPQIREWCRKDASGKIIETGTRDANLSLGWLESPPTVLAITCPTCGNWHDTKALVRKCKAAQQLLIEKSEARTKQEFTDKTSALEKQVAELTAKLDRLLEVKHR